VLEQQERIELRKLENQIILKQMEINAELGKMSESGEKGDLYYDKLLELEKQRNELAFEREALYVKDRTEKEKIKTDKEIRMKEIEAQIKQKRMDRAKASKS
jgi:hypothetical protein